MENDLCEWANNKKKWYDGMTDCYAVVESRSVIEDFYVKENNLVDWQWDSNQCNYISSGKPSWSVTLKGSDLESQKGKMCPF